VWAIHKEYYVDPPHTHTHPPAPTRPLTARPLSRLTLGPLSHRYILATLRGALAASASRVVDLMREWSGGASAIDRRALRRGVRGVGFDATDADVDALFEEMDADGSGCAPPRHIHPQTPQPGPI
jgi:hypothetical protein